MQYQGYLITDTRLRAGGITRARPRWHMLKTSTTQSGFRIKSLPALWDCLYCQYAKGAPGPWWTGLDSRVHSRMLWKNYKPETQHTLKCRNLNKQISSAKSKGIRGKGTQKVTLSKLDATITSFSFLTWEKKVENKKLNLGCEGF